MTLACTLLRPEAITSPSTDNYTPSKIEGQRMHHLFALSFSFDFFPDAPQLSWMDPTGGGDPVIIKGGVQVVSIWHLVKPYSL